MAVARNIVLWLLALAVSSGCDPSSSDDSSGQDAALQVTDVDQDNAGEVVVAFLEREGYFSGNYFHQALVAAERAVILASRGDEEGPIPPLPDDYVRSGSLSGVNSIVRMSVDGEGNIIPNPRWRLENSNYCLEKGKFLRTPIYQLQVEFHPETREVFVRLLDIETSELELAGRGSGDGEEWVDDAITEAWNQSTIPEVQQADSPCGDDIELTLVFESEITATSDDVLTNTTWVAASIPLGPTSETGVFVGSSRLLTTDYERSGPDHPYADCTWTPIHGNISAEVTVPDGNFDPDSDTNFYDNIDVSIRIQEEQAPGVRHFCTISSPDGSGQTTLEDSPWYPWFHVLNQSGTSPNRYFYPDFWDPLDEEQFGLAERVIDQDFNESDGGSTLMLDEVTTLTLYTEIKPPL